MNKVFSEEIKDKLEKLMMTLPLEATEKERRMYLAGWIDCLADQEIIDDEVREDVYNQYVT